MEQKVLNEMALEKLQESFDGQPVRDIFSDDSSTAIQMLRWNGYRCVTCREQISTGTLKFYDYGSEAKCYQCQNDNK